jgi:hypothetical protein
MPRLSLGSRTSGLAGTGLGAASDSSFSIEPATNFEQKEI